MQELRIWFVPRVASCHARRCTKVGCAMRVATTEYAMFSAARVHEYTKFMVCYTNVTSGVHQIYSGYFCYMRVYTSGRLKAAFVCNLLHKYRRLLQHFVSIRTLDWCYFEVCYQTLSYGERRARVSRILASVPEYLQSLFLPFSSAGADTMFGTQIR